jgi:amino acid adenylation domain-containing protein
LSRRFVLNTVWTTGDVMPFLRVGRALRARGHEVTLVTHGQFEARARERDLDFEPIDTPEEYRAFAQDVHLFANPQGFRTIYERHVLPKVGAELAALRRACAPSRGGEPVVVTRSTPAFAARMLRELDGIPFVPLFLAPSFVTSLPAVEALFGSVLAHAIDEIRTSQGLAPVANWSSWLATPPVSLGAWPDWFAPGLADAPRGLVRCGFFREIEPAVASVDADRLVEGEPPIFLTGGTGAYLDADFFRVTASACELLNRPGVLLTTHDALVPAHLPPRVKRVNGYLDFATFMPRTAAVVHHGGIGTLTEALAAGRPQLAMGVGGDRPENAERLSALGVGAFLPPAKWSARAVADVLERLLDSPAVAERCRALRDATLSEDAYGAACTLLETAKLLPMESEHAGPASEAAAASRGADGRRSAFAPSSAPISSVAPASSGPPSSTGPTSAGPPSSRGALSARIASLSPAKRVLLERRLAQRLSTTPAAASVIPQAPRDVPLPLSFAQERLWILDQIEPNSPVYNMPASIRLRGRVDVEALRRAFELVLERHEVLRTSYRLEGDRSTKTGASPIQVIESVGRFELPVEDIQFDRVRERAHEEAAVPFDLAKAPMLRARLLRIDEREHVLLFTTHHIASDGWSAAILFSELAAAYDALAHGRNPELRPLAIQYADYAVWQRARLADEAGAQKLAFWADLLRSPPTLELPTDRQRPPRQRYQGGQLVEDLPLDTCRRVHLLKREASVTLYMLLLAAFAALLERLSGDTDVVVGSPVANRGQQELDDLIGFFVNTIALRVDTSGEPTWRQLVAQVKDLTLRAHAHQDVPFDRVVAAVQPERLQDRSPLFQVLFAVQNTPSRSIVLSELELIPLTFETTTSKFDLSLYVYEEGEQLSLSWEYDSDLFDRATIARFSKVYARLVDALSRHPDERVHSCEVLDPEERSALLRDAIGKKPEWSAGETIVSLFEAQLKRAPDAVAFRGPGSSITYRELDERAARVARSLVERGVGPEAYVGVCLPRSIDSVVASLAAMKAGAAFVPLDPAYPVTRLELMAGDARLSVVISDGARASLAARLAQTVVRIDEAHGSRIEHAPPVGPQSAAYVVYTSGSTGRPKGVVGTHGATVNRLRWMWEEFPFAAGEVGVLKTSINFVDAIAETFGPLLAGVPSLVLGDDVARDPLAMVAALHEAKVTRIVVVPSLLRVMLEAPDAARRLAGLRLWVTSGEALPDALAERFFETLPDATLLNLYGSSEAAGDSTYAPVVRGKMVSLGQPIAHTIAYVLDSRMRLVARGMTGELWLGGRGLSRGYLHQPDLTAERFVPDPISTDKSSVLYRTGDRVRLSPDGALVFVGRTDQRVKLRGTRIEIGEVVSALRGIDDVRDAVVLLAKPAGEGTEMLVAYVVPKPGARPAPDEWRAKLHETLPDVMVPSVIVPLEAFPLTPNGKIDRRALAARDVSTGAGRMPTTASERLVARIWCSVLGREHVGADEDFFTLGGNSLSGITVVNRLRDTFRVSLEPRVIFEKTTVEQLVRAIVDAWEGQNEIVEEIAQLTLEVEGLSDEEVSARLGEVDDS